MNLDQVTVAIRPRNQWEAIDAGFMMARTRFGRLWLLWVTSALPFFIISIVPVFAFPNFNPAWPLFFFWVCKPLYEPFVLFWCGRYVFGEDLAIKEVIAETRKSVSGRNTLTVLRHRLSFSRSFSLPVLLLEGLSGKARQERLKLLGTGYETAMYLTICSFCIEIFLTASIMMIVFWFIPREILDDNFGKFVTQMNGWLFPASYFLSCSALAPFYVCGGFFLYISRRVELEAWDIEIGFKRIAQRLREQKSSFKTIVSVLIFCLFTSGVLLPHASKADEPNPENAKTAITRVFQQKEFGTKTTEYRWVPKQEKTDGNGSDWWKTFLDILDSMSHGLSKFARIIANIGWFLVWIAVGALTAFVLFRYTRIRQWLSSGNRTNRDISKKPSILFGMDIRPESLPQDLVSVFRELIAQGKKRAALSLLYRGTLSRLVGDCRLQIESSFTEGDCCKAVRMHRPEIESSYFDRLTALWLTTAYGHEEPDAASCLDLAGQWQNHFRE